MKIRRKSDYTLIEEIDLHKDDYEYRDDFGPMTIEQKQLA